VIFRFFVFCLPVAHSYDGRANLQVMAKRLHIHGTTLRTRPNDYKRSLIAQFENEVMPAFSSGKVKPIIDSIYAFDKVEEAHKRMQSNENIGKLLLKVR